MNSYSPTGNVDDYYNQQGSQGLTPDQITPRDEFIKQEEEEEGQLPQEQPSEGGEQSTPTQPEEKTEQKTEEKEEGANPLQEVGTAVIGAGIDFAESLGETAERTIKGKWMDWDWQPTWLQVDDNVEPMNKTVWGNVLRTIGEFGVGFLLTGGIGTAAGAASKAKYLTKIAPVLKGTQRLIGTGKRTTWAGKAAQGSAKGAVTTFVSSSSQEETLNDQLQEMMPWIPSITTTSESSSPLENRMKAVLEDLALGNLFELVGAFRAGKGAAARLDAGIDSADPNAVKAAKQLEITSAQKNAIQDTVKLDLEIDPQIASPHPHIHPDYFDAADKGLRTVEPNSAYQALKDMMAMNRRGDYAAGRRANLMTDATLKRITLGASEEVTRLVTDLRDEIQKGLEIPAGQNVAGMGVSMEEVANLGLAKYFDVVSTFPDLKKGVTDFEEIKEMLLEDAISVPDVEGFTREYMNAASVMAYEMLMTDIAQAVSDTAATRMSLGAQSLEAIEGINRMMDFVEAAYLFNNEASEFSGSLLRARQGVSINPAKRIAQSQDKKQQIKEFMRSLRKVMRTEPEKAELFTRAFAESNGDVATMEALRRYAADRLFTPGALVGARKSEVITQLFSTLYNSILSSPVTLARAFTGTGVLTMIKPLQTALGGAVTGDMNTVRKGLAMASFSFESIGEAIGLANNTRTSLIKNTPGPYAPVRVSAADDRNWDMLGVVVEETGDLGQKMQYRMSNALRHFNRHSWVAYPQHGMAAIDTYFKTLIGRQELKAKAFDKVILESADGKVTPDLIKKAELELRNTIFNEQGEVVDITSKRFGKEAALQLPLEGKLGQVTATLTSVPLLQPFFLFAKTGVNAINVSIKHTPILARFNSEVNNILSASADDFSKVLEYGISDAQSLKQAQALVKGRIATGYVTVAASISLYMNGNLSGNGPQDYKDRQAAMATGWKPRSIKIGGTWVNYDGIEPFASFLALIADIGDNANTLNSTASEDMFRKLGYIIAMNLTNKSYLAGVQNLQNIVSLNPDRMKTWGAQMLNNFFPGGGARNTIANLMHPGLREVETDFLQTIANRNPFGRGLLPIKYDPLDGSVVNEYDFPTRLLNTISPFQISGKDTETRKLLRDSGFDLTTEFKTDSLGNPLSPQQASRLQQLMGQYNIEKQLEKLYKDPAIRAEIEYYRQLREDNIPGKSKDDPRNTRFEDSRVYNLTRQIFNDAKARAMQELYLEYPELRETSIRRDARAGAQRAGDTDLVDQLLIPTR